MQKKKNFLGRMISSSSSRRPVDDDALDRSSLMTILMSGTIKRANKQAACDTTESDGDTSPAPFEYREIPAADYFSAARIRPCIMPVSERPEKKIFSVSLYDSSTLSLGVCLYIFFCRVISLCYSLTLCRVHNVYTYFLNFYQFLRTLRGLFCYAHSDTL